mgnify:CR=1 FL=1
MYIVSLEAVINEITAVVGSIVYFNSGSDIDEEDDDDFTALAKVFFSIGLAIGVSGVLLLAFWRKEMDSEGEPDLFEQDPSTWLVDDEEVKVCCRKALSLFSIE